MPDRIELDRLDRCARCHWDLRPGDVAVWDPERGEVRCTECAAQAPPVTVEQSIRYESGIRG